VSTFVIATAVGVLAYAWGYTTGARAYATFPEKWANPQVLLCGATLMAVVVWLVWALS